HASARVCSVSRKAPRFVGTGQARRFRRAFARYPCEFAARRDCASGGVANRRRRTSGLREEKVTKSPARSHASAWERTACDAPASFACVSQPALRRSIGKHRLVPTQERGNEALDAKIPWNSNRNMI